MRGVVLTLDALLALLILSYALLQFFLPVPALSPLEEIRRNDEITVELETLPLDACVDRGGCDHPRYVFCRDLRLHEVCE